MTTNKSTPREMWEWHTIEKTEHKGVYFDAYETANGGFVISTI